MMRQLFVLLSLSILLSGSHINIKKEYFSTLNTQNSSAVIEMRYFGSNNFLGRQVQGYKAPICYLSNEATSALKKVEIALKKEQLRLVIFDCYRPQRAVDDFVLWAKKLNDTKMKDIYYPQVQKKDLFKEGYIAAKSGHSRGSTIDLSISTLDMGTPFDYFDPRSHTMSPKVTPAQLKNRLYLKKVMEDNGFKNYPKEWWHYTLKNEPFPKKYFDFVIE